MQGLHSMEDSKQIVYLIRGTSLMHQDIIINNEGKIQTNKITFSAIVFVFLNKDKRDATYLMMKDSFVDRSGKRHDIELYEQDLNELSHEIQITTRRFGFFYNINFLV